MILEKERKWVLNGVPTSEPGKTLSIFQYYTKDGRFRSSTNMGTKQTSFYHTLKKPVSAGINEETEIGVTVSTFYGKLWMATKALHKVRLVFGLSNNLKAEVDVFNFGLVLLEIEVPEMSTELNLPHWLSALMGNEVTGNDEYSNYNLAVKI